MIANALLVSWPPGWKKKPTLAFACVWPTPWDIWGGMIARLTACSGTPYKGEHHFHTRWKLIEAYALLTRKEEFILEQIVQPILAQGSDEKNRRQAFEILCQVEYYTDSLLHDIIQQLPAFSAPLSKSALTYLAAAPSIPEHDRPELQAYLQRVIHDDMADSILRNRAFETLYTIYDLLNEEFENSGD